MISEDDFQQLISGRTVSTSPLLNRISFNDLPLAYDKTGNRWFYTAPSDTQLHDITVSYSAYKKNIGIAFTREIVPGHTVPMIVYTEDEYEVSAIVITTIPIMQIDCETTEIWINSIPMQFTLIDNRNENRQPVIKSEGTIHVRGNTAQLHPKKPYRISLTTKSIGGVQKENQISILGMRKDDDWILYPAYNDQEKIRNVFSSNLWFNSCAGDNSFGMKNGMEYRYVELLLNHQYWGLYAVGFPIDAKQMGIQPEKNGHYEEFLFKQKSWGPTSRDYSDIREYLISQIIMLKADEDYGLSVMEMFFEHIYTDCPNGMYNYDVKNAIDVWLFLKLIQAMDSIDQPGKINNMIYSIKSIDGERKLIYTPWDMDATWGNESGFQFIDYRIDPSDNSLEMTLNPVSVLLNNDNQLGLSKKIKQRYTELRQESWSDQAVDAMLDGFEQDIYGSGAYVRDAERWPHGGYQDPDIALSRFRTYVHKRFESLDAFIENL